MPTLDHARKFIQKPEIIMPRLLAYLQERFPPVNMMLFAILHLAVYSATEVERSFGPVFWLGILATISFFFRLRVMDEIKDYDLDAVNHPQRVLQSGGVTLGFLIGAVGGVDAYRSVVVIPPRLANANVLGARLRVRAADALRVLRRRVATRATGAVCL